MRSLAIFALALALACAPMTAFAHSGGTDSSGCHNSSTGRHCHGGGGGGGGTGEGLPPATALLLIGGITIGSLLLVWASMPSSPNSRSSSGLDLEEERPDDPEDGVLLFDAWVGDEGGGVLMGVEW